MEDNDFGLDSVAISPKIHWNSDAAVAESDLIIHYKTAPKTPEFSSDLQENFQNVPHKTGIH